MHSVRPVLPEFGFVEVRVAIEKLENHTFLYTGRILTQLS